MRRASHRLFAALFLVVSTLPCLAAPRSHPAMRPPPVVSNAALAPGPKFFIDPARGDDAADGSLANPWKTLAAALPKLNPGDTLYLRAGIYYEHASLSRSGTPEAPITIAAHPGELPIIDGGLREFADDPANAWQPVTDGAPGEYRSTRTYPAALDRKIPNQFIPASWEPLLGLEDERPLALGFFADSMVPLHGYRTVTDLRSTNEFWRGKNGKSGEGLYCGPGLWLDRRTARIHVRLGHHALAGLGDNGYRGETDPRKLPLIIAAGFGDDVLRINGVRHVRLHGIALRGSTGSPLIHVYGAQDVTLDHLTVYGGFPALLVNATKNLSVTHCAFRGTAAPWTSRAHQKYRGTPSYQVIFQDRQPLNDNIEFAHCEFTDDHDFAYFRFATNLRFHHNFVDNFNDDGLECGPKLRSHTIYISQNRIGRCLIPLTQHEINKDESPAEHDPNSGVYVFRNVFDQRGGTYKSPPTQPEPDGNYLRGEGHLAGDHGGPVWPVMRVYHNTMLRHTPVFRDGYLFGLGSQGLRGTERDVFNNVFVQTEKVPGIGFVAMKQAENVREGGNILWGLRDGPTLKADPFAKFRASPLFADSKRRYEAGWTTHDRMADPKFVKLAADGQADLRLSPDSPAVDFGRPVPAEWPDPLRAADKNAPDAGVLPIGAEA
ncbi:MAG TPA: hypothetical protein VK986_07370, partial [Tepidisphaeraceae bacterium]|nr:hypothetical protein [Tepidisphaeraceae bacterium]